MTSPTPNFKTLLGTENRDRLDRFKRIYENAWDIRNNSGNVSAALNPDSQSAWGNWNDSNTKHPKTTITSDKPYKKHCLPKHACEECYCRKPPILPKLKLKLMEDEYESTPPGKCIKSHCCCYCEKHDSETLLGEDEDNYHHLHVPRKPFDHKQWRERQFTIPRRVYEEFRTPMGFEEEYMKALEDYEKQRAREESNGDDEILTLGANRNLEENLKKLNTFRKENYFDCYSNEYNKESKIPEHQCIHKFTINDRLIPQPLNADPFGMSRCIICQKPMKSRKASKNETKQKFFKTSNRGCNQGNILWDHGWMAPSQINIANDNELVKMQMSSNLEECKAFFDTCIKIKDPKPFNSLALRHQKGII